MALTSDPLSWIPTLGLRESAWLSVHLVANDIATTSQAPQLAQLVLNLPETATSTAFEEYWMFVHKYCKEIGVAITGGHTGKATGQHSTLAGGGTMISIAPAGKMLLSKYARPGDLIMVTKEAAQVATSIPALSFPEMVKRNVDKRFGNRRLIFSIKPAPYRQGYAQMAWVLRPCTMLLKVVSSAPSMKWPQPQVVALSSMRRNYRWAKPAGGLPTL